jgi:hypothetical protein
MFLQFRDQNDNKLHSTIKIMVFSTLILLLFNQYILWIDYFLYITRDNPLRLVKKLSEILTLRDLWQNSTLIDLTWLYFRLTFKLRPLIKIKNTLVWSVLQGILPCNHFKRVSPATSSTISLVPTSITKSWKPCLY